MDTHSSVGGPLRDFYGVRRVRVLSVRQQHDDRGGESTPRRRRVRRGRLPRAGLRRDEVQRRHHSSTERRRALRLQAVDGGAQRLAIVGRRLHDQSSLTEGHDADPGVTGTPLHEGLRGQLCGFHPRGTDVIGSHAGRHVQRQHYRALHAGHRQRQMRPGRSQREDGDRDQEDDGRDMAPPSRQRGRSFPRCAHGTQTVRVPAPLLLQAHVEEDAYGQRKQRDEYPWPDEGHRCYSRYRLCRALPRSEANRRIASTRSSCVDRGSSSTPARMKVWASSASRRRAASWKRRRNPLSLVSTLI